MTTTAIPLRGEALVLGAGVVGLTSAWALVQSGWRVRVMDAQGVGLGTSLRNGGQLSYRYVAPLADAGIPGKALRWMLEADGPLRWKPAARWQDWWWLARFLLRCNRHDHRQTTDRLAKLGQFSRETLARWMDVDGLAGFDWTEAGKMVLHRRPTALAVAAAARAPEQVVWDRAQCLAQEPALAQVSEPWVGAVVSRDEAVADCHRFCEVLAQRLRQHPRFQGFQQLPVQRLVNQGSRTGVQTSEGVTSADAVVVALGMGSRPLLQGVGEEVPLLALKGYSLDVPVGPHHRAPRWSVTDFDRKVLYAPIGGRLRVAAMVDLVGDSPAIDPQRLASLLRIATTDMPAAADWNAAQPWAGLRPATPSGAPIVAAARQPGLWLNLGHGALGFTFAAGTAALLAHLMNGQGMPEPLAGTRFTCEAAR